MIKLIKRKIQTAIFIALAITILAATGLNATDSGYAPWLITVCPELAPEAGPPQRIHDATSASAAIESALAALSSADCQCDDAINFAMFYVEHAITRGTTLDMPANGRLYADILQISAEVAQTISESAVSALAAKNIQLPREINTNIHFFSNEDGVLNIHFPDDISSTANLDNITIETGFASITLNSGFISGSAIRLERSVPVASGGYIYVNMQTIAAINNNLPVSITESTRFGVEDILDYWAVAAFVVIILIWGILASMGKKLRLWVVPLIAVILIAANIWTLRERPGDPVYSPAPVYFYAVSVVMSPDMDAVLSIPLYGADPAMLMIVDDSGEVLLSRHNPFTDTIDAQIHAGGVYSLQVMDIRG